MPGLLKKREREREAEIPASSMADIGFLLLIFFLVTTTISVPTGIGMVLPPPLEENVEPPPVEDRNMLKVLINEQGQVLVEGELSSVQRIRRTTKEFILNYGQDPTLSDTPDDAVISIKTAAQTPYDVYIDVLDEVWMAYRGIWDQVAQTGQLPTGEQILDRGYPNYETYVATFPEGEAGDNPIRENIPAAISIAEPPDLQEQSG